MASWGRSAGGRQGRHAMAGATGSSGRVVGRGRRRDGGAATASVGGGRLRRPPGARVQRPRGAAGAAGPTTGGGTGRAPARGRAQRPARREARPARRRGRHDDRHGWPRDGRGRQRRNGARRRRARRDDRAALHRPDRPVVEHRDRREDGAPDGGHDRGREPEQRPGQPLEPSYASGIARLTAAGIKVIGYVATDYTANSAATVKADIDRWRTFYPGQLSGIFFDEQSNQAERRRLLSRPVAIREGAGAVVHGRQPGHRHRRGLRRRDGHDADLRERRASRRSSSSAGWHANHAPSNFGIIPLRGGVRRGVRARGAQIRQLHLPAERRPAQPVGQPAAATSTTCSTRSSTLGRQTRVSASGTDAVQPRLRAGAASCCPWALRRRTGTRTCGPG